MAIRGVFAPVPTPFTAAGELDLGAWRNNVARWVGTELHGLVVLGSTGEAPLLDDDEADRLIVEARRQMPTGRLLVAGTGRQSTKATISASRRAAEAGADMVLVRTPSYFRGQMTATAFIGHYSAVADASPVPVLLYNFSALTGVTLPVAAVEALSGHQNILGVKESGPDMSYVGDLVGLSSESFSVPVGSAPTFFASLTLGAHGGILALACVVPDLCVRIYDLVEAGCFDDARQLQRLVVPLATLVTTTYGIAGLKAALDEIGYAGGCPRLPLQPIQDDAVAQIRHHIEVLAGSAPPARRTTPRGDLSCLSSEPA